MALKVPIRFKEEDNTGVHEAERVFDMEEWYKLHSCSNSTIKLIIARSLDSFALTVKEWVVLIALANDNKGDITASEIAKSFDMDMPQATVLLRKLIDKSLIRQKTNVKDRRVKQLSCTREGKRVAFESDQAVQKSMRYWLFDLSDSEIEKYLEITRKIIKFELPNG